MGGRGADRAVDPPAGRAYLDNAATTPMRPEAVAAMLPYLAGEFANPSGAHAASRRARRALDLAREQVAELLGGRPGELVWTSGGTEADNLALRGVEGAAGGRCIVSAVEHRAVLRPALAIGARLAPVRRDGTVDLDELDRLLDPGVQLVSVMAVNSEVGVIQPLEQVVELVRVRAPDALVHTDAVQAAPWLDVARLAAACDLVSFSAHKLGGPKGLGALLVRPRARPRLRALLLGGGQEGGLRAGTEPVAAAVAAGVAAQLCAAEREERHLHVSRLRDRLVDGLLAACPGAHEPAPRDRRVPGSAHLAFPGLEAEELLFLLDRAEVAASTGSACASGAREPSHVLSAMGWDPAATRSAVRFSLGPATTAAEVDHALAVVPESVRRLRAGTGA